MRCEDYLENSYWNNKGKYQKEYDEMKADESFEFTKATRKVFHSYYRFHNDGDTPTSYRYYAEKYQEIIEKKADERILAEYKRFKKANKEEK
jgi:hypothetical protein